MSDAEVLDQLHAKLPPDCLCSTVDSIERHAGAVWFEQAVQLRPAGAHAASHLHPCETLLLHLLLDLHRQHANGSETRRLFLDSFVAEEVIE